MGREEHGRLKPITSSGEQPAVVLLSCCGSREHEMSIHPDPLEAPARQRLRRGRLSELAPAVCWKIERRAGVLSSSQLFTLRALPPPDAYIWKREVPNVLTPVSS